MKKIKIYFLLFMLAAAFTVNSCKKEEKKTLSCEELYTNFMNAFTAFATEQNEATCTDYENALVNFLEGCSYYSGVNRAELQQWVDDNDCSDFNTGK